MKDRKSGENHTFSDRGMTVAERFQALHEHLLELVSRRTEERTQDDLVCQLAARVGLQVESSNEAQRLAVRLQTAATEARERRRSNDVSFESTVQQLRTLFSENVLSSVDDHGATVDSLRAELAEKREQLEASVDVLASERESLIRRKYEERETQYQEAGMILSAKLKESERQNEILEGALAAAQEELDRTKNGVDEPWSNGEHMAVNGCASVSPGEVTERETLDDQSNSLAALLDSTPIKKEPGSEAEPSGFADFLDQMENGPCSSTDCAELDALLDAAGWRKVQQQPDVAEDATNELRSIIFARVDSLQGNPVDTAETAAAAKRLLAVHNIGQRLFARVVLDQSQGAVSELLSKPKPWHRLTDKGKESFRKIWAWVNEPEAIEILSSLNLATRRGEVAPIGVLCSPESASPGTAKTSQAAATNWHTPAVTSTESEIGLTEAKISAILSNAQLQIQAASQSASISPSVSISPRGEYSDDFSENGGGSRSRDKRSDRYRHDDIPKEMVYEIYQRELRELEKIKETKPEEVMGAEQQPLRRKGARAPRSKQQPPSPQKETSVVVNVSAVVPQEAAPKPKKQRSSPATTVDGLTGTKLLKAILPPITQEEFERCIDLNTFEIVNLVKDFLSKHSVSQRTFGEQVLGLSQGSVSDLLARPKPWGMLTQKGREPFIRMQLFLDDPTNITKVQSTASNGSSQSNGDHPIPSNSSTEFDTNDVSADHIFSNQLDVMQLGPLPVTPALSLRESSPSNLGPPSPPISVAPRWSIQQMANDQTMELPSAEIAERVKADLVRFNIGQRLFGEAIVSLSQGTVSELLSHPKPWPSLSAKGREPFIRMHLWLQDDLRDARLAEYKLNRVRKKLYESSSSETEAPTQDDSCESSIESGGTGTTKKKMRLVLSEAQKAILKGAFEMERYPSTNSIQELSSTLGLSARTVTNWFHNHRMRVKCDVVEPVANGIQPVIMECPIEESLILDEDVDTPCSSERVSGTRRRKQTAVRRVVECYDPLTIGV